MVYKYSDSLYRSHALWGKVFISLGMLSFVLFGLRIFFSRPTLHFSLIPIGFALIFAAGLPLLFKGMKYNSICYEIDSSGLTIINRYGLRIGIKWADISDVTETGSSLILFTSSGKEVIYRNLKDFATFYQTFSKFARIKKATGEDGSAAASHPGRTARLPRPEGEEPPPAKQEKSPRKVTVNVKEAFTEKLKEQPAGPGRVSPSVLKPADSVVDPKTPVPPASEAHLARSTVPTVPGPVPQKDRPGRQDLVKTPVQPVQVTPDLKESQPFLPPQREQPIPPPHKGQLVAPPQKEQPIPPPQKEQPIAPPQKEQPVAPPQKEQLAEKVPSVPRQQVPPGYSSDIQEPFRSPSGGSPAGQPHHPARIFARPEESLSADDPRATNTIRDFMKMRMAKDPSSQKELSRKPAEKSDEISEPFGTLDLQIGQAHPSTAAAPHTPVAGPADQTQIMQGLPPTRPPVQKSLPSSLEELSNQVLSFAIGERANETPDEVTRYTIGDKSYEIAGRGLPSDIDSMTVEKMLRKFLNKLRQVYRR